jgi:hypothetical protein
MADRYPNRPADNYDRGDQSGAGEGDPLAELARLIGQTDPFSSTSRANPPAQPARAVPPRPQYQPQYDEAQALDEEAPAGPPSWMQRANLQRPAATHELQEEGYYEPSHEPPLEEEPADYQPSPIHPLQRYAAAAAPAPAYQDDYREPAYDEAEEQADPARYDAALYGQLESGAQDFQRDPAYPDDPYAYQDGYEDEPEVAPKRRGGLLTVAAVLALAVVGTGAAFAYRTYAGSPRSGDPPIIKADNTPTKVVPAPADNAGKNPDRLPASDGSEKIVPREEKPVDVNAQASAGPRVVLPGLSQNPNPPSPASVATNAIPTSPPAAPPSNGTMPNNEPRRVKTFSVHGDQPDSAATPVTAAPTPAKPVTRQVTRAPPPAANAPLSLSPDSAQASIPEPHTRVASTTPAPIAPAGEAAPPAGEGRFLVSITSQPTEAEAQSSFRSMQQKHPDQLGSRSPIIKKVDKKGGGSAYRALVGPFASREEATHFCTSYSSAGGQCWVP